jgi:chemosensory pili system protein ChpA (sensor histidine kinase/response regulator)
MPPVYRQPPLLLVIDDDPGVREVLQCQLEALGARVVVAADGFEGLDQLGRWRPTAVLCDIAMPGMDGVEFATRMRKDARFRDVPLIAVTGLNGQTDLLRTWGAGFDGHVGKPLTADVLAGIVQRFASRSSVAQERRTA